MVLKRTRLHTLLQSGQLVSRAKTGLSLHSHTEHSRESLDFLPVYADRIPVIAKLCRREYKLYRERERRCIDFSTAYWTPPLTPHLVYSAEEEQINNAGLNAIVSITDHDCIDANLAVVSSDPSRRVPISMEWTVPFDRGFFHLGIHNIPREQASRIAASLLAYTYNASDSSAAKLDELFSLLENIPEVLVVLNHPLWDIEMVGADLHMWLLAEFIKTHGRWFHALEVNGFRSWSENKAVIQLAEALDLPVVAGGDRHGYRPNTVVNISSCDTFGEFAADIRNGKRSEVVLMPQYERPLISRQLESFAEILGEYPQLGRDRSRWVHRLFFDVGDGKGPRSIFDLGVIKGPFWMRSAIRTLGILGSPRMALLFRVARNRADRVPPTFDKSEFNVSDVEDISRNLSSEPVL
jgi:hypothetical protein